MCVCECECVGVGVGVCVLVYVCLLACMFVFVFMHLGVRYLSVPVTVMWCVETQMCWPCVQYLSSLSLS